MGKKANQSQDVYNRMAWEYDTAPEGHYTKPHKAELSKKADVHAFGVDISENMIALAKERHPSCTFAVSPCTPLGFESDSMDIITVSCAFHYFETPRLFVNECMRILKKKGKFFIAEHFFSPVVRWLYHN